MAKTAAQRQRPIAPNVPCRSTGNGERRLSIWIDQTELAIRRRTQ